MTLALSVKVNDGVVLAADSASTIIAKDPNSNQNVAINVYNNANKVFNLYKGLPIGVITWGAGSIGAASTSSLVKDLRELLKKPDALTLGFDPDTYTIEQAAQVIKQFMFDQHYVSAFQNWPEKPILGFMVAGYSTNGSLAEEYQIDIINGQCTGPYLLKPKENVGVQWNGQGEALHRLLLGRSSILPNLIMQTVHDQQTQNLLNNLWPVLNTPLVTEAMPIQDAIDLAEFLVETTIKYTRFSPGAETVGGPIEIAAITKHEGFKWVRRKHYFKTDLNPTFQ